MAWCFLVFYIPNETLTLVLKYYFHRSLLTKVLDSLHVLYSQVIVILIQIPTLHFKLNIVIHRTIRRVIWVQLTEIQSFIIFCDVTESEGGLTRRRITTAISTHTSSVLLWDCDWQQITVFIYRDQTSITNKIMSNSLESPR